jgi:uncharacterized protein YbcI
MAKDAHSMDKPRVDLAQQIAQAARAFERQRTGHGPRSVTVVMSDDVLVITLHGALSQAERNLAGDPDGAARLQEFHRQLFATSGAMLRQEIERICGVKVCEASAEVAPGSGTVMKVFATGTIVQVFLLADSVKPDMWSTTGPGPTRAASGSD